MRVTTVGRWRHGTQVNLERPLKFGDELGGHLVAGHVDGLATVIAREDLTDMARFVLRAPAELARFIAPKGSVALDGVSLTVNAVEGDTFSVLIIPHTLQVTTFGALRTGRRRQSGNRPDGALRRAADGGALVFRATAKPNRPLFAARAACYHALNKDNSSHGQENAAGATKARATLRMLIVEARFYEHIADALLRGATRALDAAGAHYDRITVPGALEIPPAIAMARRRGRSAKRAPYDGVVALGCVIHGETYHFEIVSNESARGLMELARRRQLAHRQRHSHRRDRSPGAGARRRRRAATRARGAARAALAMVALKRSLGGK